LLKETSQNIDGKKGAVIFDYVELGTNVITFSRSFKIAAADKSTLMVGRINETMGALVDESQIIFKLAETPASSTGGDAKPKIESDSKPVPGSGTAKKKK
jgi:hypothetical protein